MTSTSTQDEEKRAAFTPGPFYAIHHGTSLKHEIRKDIGDVSHLVAVCEDWGDETEHNARLMAAAPDLLAALVECAGALDGAARCMRKVDAPNTAAKLEAIALTAMRIVLKATQEAA